MNTLPDVPLPPATQQAKSGSKRSWIAIVVVCACVAVIVVLFIGRSMTKNYRLGHAAVDEFHRRLDRGDYDSIYANATSGFQKADSREIEVEFFAKVHAKMGSSGEMTPLGFHVSWQNGHTEINEVFSTKFAQGAAREDFIWVVDGGAPKLHMYRINAPQFR